MQAACFRGYSPRAKTLPCSSVAPDAVLLPQHCAVRRLRRVLVTHAGASDDTVKADDLPPAGCERVRLQLTKPLGLVLEASKKTGSVFIVEVLPEGNAAKDGRVEVVAQGVQAQQEGSRDAAQGDNGGAARSFPHLVQVDFQADCEDEDNDSQLGKDVEVVADCVRGQRRCDEASSVGGMESKIRRGGATAVPASALTYS